MLHAIVKDLSDIEQLGIIEKKKPAQIISIFHCSGQQVALDATGASTTTGTVDTYHVGKRSYFLRHTIDYESHIIRSPT